MASNGKNNFIPKDQWIAQMKAKGGFNKAKSSDQKTEKVPFKDLPEEVKKAWFEKKGIKYLTKEEWMKKNKRSFGELSEAEKKAWCEKKGIPYVSKKDWIEKQKRYVFGLDDGDDGNDEAVDCDIQEEYSDCEAQFSASDFGL